MNLIAIVLVPLLGGVLAWLSGRAGAALPRWISLAVLGVDLALVLPYWGAEPSLTQGAGVLATGGTDAWIAAVNVPWIPSLGVQLHLALDGLSLVLVLLTIFLGFISVACSWTEIRTSVGFFHFNLLWILSGIIGVFLAMDLFLFYFFWELMLIPMYFLINGWGHENRTYAAVKFFIFTQASGLFMLLAILGLYFVHGSSTGVYTFNAPDLIGTELPPDLGMWLMLGFFIAFAVKLPVVPVHTWLPDAHTEAPTAGSVILAGLLLKTGGYGLLRFVLPLFPDASATFAPIAMGLAVAGILYGALLATSQTDLKRLIAYTSVSHLGFVLLGIYARNELALEGALLQMVCHGISTGALFVIVGGIQERIHTRDLSRMGGFWTLAPRMGAVAVLFAMASLGLPGLGNFIGEMLVLLGSYQASVVWTSLAALGLVAGTIYSLDMLQKAFLGPAPEDLRLPDLSKRDMLVQTARVAAIVWLGFFPQPVVDQARLALRGIESSAASLSTDDAKPVSPLSPDSASRPRP